MGLDELVGRDEGRSAALTTRSTKPGSGQYEHRIDRRATRLPVITFTALVVLGSCAATLRWQTGACTDVGVRRDVRVGAGASGSRPFGPEVLSKPTMPEVAAFAIETASQHIDTQEVVPIGPGSANLSIGDVVTIAIKGHTAYVRDAHGVEYRLLVTRVAARPSP
jgi:hypothetical protein